MKQVYTTGAQVDMNTWNVYVTDDFGLLIEVGFCGLAVYHPNLDLDMGSQLGRSLGGKMLVPRGISDKIIV